ncbi:MAG: hypothetical protein R2827_04935 [Bdellovibrionales bacterium]
MALIGICTVPILLGQFVRAYAVGFSGNKTSGRNTSAGQVAESINKTGMYSMVRHPSISVTILCGLAHCCL